jgi:Phage integrase, N-terminal SAM-like domain
MGGACHDLSGQWSIFGAAPTYAQVSGIFAAVMLPFLALVLSSESGDTQDKKQRDWRAPVLIFSAFVFALTSSYLYALLSADPRRARITVREFADRWLTGRTDLAERTRELYRYLLDKHVFPTLGTTTLGSLSPSDVRKWHQGIADAHPTTAAKAYRLLSTIMKTAVSDEVVARNPCQVKGAASEKAPERPVASMAEVQSLADAMPENQRIAVLLASWCQLHRWKCAAPDWRHGQLQRRHRQCCLSDVPRRQLGLHILIVRQVHRASIARTPTFGVVRRGMQNGLTSRNTPL